MIYGHGNELASKIRADFSANTWYQGMHEELFMVLKNSISNITNPEPDASGLKENIAGYYQINARNVIVTNGSTEAFYLIAQAFAEAKSVIICPSFSEYNDACQMYRHQIVHLKNNPGWQNIKFENRLVWFANPNNPDGRTITLYEIMVSLQNNPSSVFVLDEAYIDLCYGIETAIPLLAEYSNLIIVRSFTKTFSIPGLRLGFMISSEKIANIIKSLLMPWNVNSLAIDAGDYIMKHYDRLLPDKAMIREESLAFQKELGKNRKLIVYPSNCNFFMVQLLVGSARGLKKFLLDEFGVLIRNASNFTELDKSFFRISIQEPEKNKLLIKGIKYWMQL